MRNLVENLYESDLYFCFVIPNLTKFFVRLFFLLNFLTTWCPNFKECGVSVHI